MENLVNLRQTTFPKMLSYCLLWWYVHKLWKKSRILYTFTGDRVTKEDQWLIFMFWVSITSFGRDYFYWRDLLIDIIIRWVICLGRRNWFLVVLVYRRTSCTMMFGFSIMLQCNLRILKKFQVLFALKRFARGKYLPLEQAMEQWFIRIICMFLEEDVQTVPQQFIDSPWRPYNGGKCNIMVNLQILEHISQHTWSTVMW